MVALYLQNSKKILALSIFLTVISISIYAKNPIGDFIDLEIKIEKDTLTKEDSLKLCLEFTNFSKGDIIFYPIANTFIVKNFVTFGIDNALEINKIVDFTFPVRLQPDQSFQKHHQVPINDFFSIGENIIWVEYWCFFPNRINYEGLCGELSSQKVKIYVH